MAMKPFRIYEVEAGKLVKFKYGKYCKHKHATLGDAVNSLRSIFISRNRQFAIMEYVDLYKAKIVKLIET